MVEMADKRNAYRSLLVKPEGKKYLGDLNTDDSTYIRTCHTEIGFKGMYFYLFSVPSDDRSI